MNLRTFTTSVGYDDYLHHTLPWNKGRCGEMTVITSANDHATQEVCHRHGVRTFLGPRMTDGWRGWPVAYNDCLSAERHLEWVLITDADILLPRDFLSMMAALPLDPGAFYFTSRVYLPMDYERIDEHVHTACAAARFDALGWTHLPPETWGYFMLFHWNNPDLQNKMFAEDGRGGGHDIEYAMRFTNRVALPTEFAVAHIPHGTWDDWGKNWGGRKTDRLKT